MSRADRNASGRRPHLIATLLIVSLSWVLAWSVTSPSTVNGMVRSEVVVYGATPAGIMAAVTAARAGASVTLLEPGSHVGGMMSSGLSFTDIGNANTIGGYTREFFDLVQAAEGTLDGRFKFQPHTAEDVFRTLLHGAKVRVRYGERLPDRGGLVRDGTRIKRVTMASGHTYGAGVYIDASYEGDLMARAGVTYRVGREATTAYNESLAGVGPTSRLLLLEGSVRPLWLTTAPGPAGSADARIQDSNYRLCFSDDPNNQTPIVAPAGYRSDDYDVYVDYLLARAEATGVEPRLSMVLRVSAVANHKFDVNDTGPFSMAVPGLNWSYPEANHAARLTIEQRHRAYSQGLIYYLATDDNVPPSIRSEMARFGLCADEFTDNGHWPWLLYLREGRRMVGAYVVRQSDIQTYRRKPDMIAVASYRVDSHYVSRWVDADGWLSSEGTLSLPYRTYAVPYRAITPKRTQVTNLLVPVALSATHVAQSSLRMEPQFMMIGEAAGEAAAMATVLRAVPSLATRSASATSSPTSGATSPITPLVRAGFDVQAIDVNVLQARLRAHGAYLTPPGT